MPFSHGTYISVMVRTWYELQGTHFSCMPEGDNIMGSVKKCDRSQ